MNGYLILAGAIIISFADREFGSITMRSGTHIGLSYPLLGVLMIVYGLLGS
jgi:hypothetical protein